ncbi:uncharacterized protein LOC142047758 [Chelonoidis abingdonii]|uniref:uncharacterized protein LOC142047758 n=1 Tax=Chelonoidis abingdonii TaxID=106734 RepID=UPI003F4978C3
MKSAGIFLLVGLLTLWVVLPSWSGTILPVQQIPREKSGICPVVSVRCKMLSLPLPCQSDSQCAGAEKCCDTSCGLGCILTQQGNCLIGYSLRICLLVTAKPGTCPLIASTCRMINPPDKCKEDRDCIGPKKCCMSVCGKECLPPNQVRSGTCPVVPFRCKMRNPPNRCRSDSQCAGEEKCCDTGCGRGCVLTQKEKPGTCPVVTVRCLMINPANSCYHDHQCPGPKKCCETSCGRHCVLLQRGTGLSVTGSPLS